MVCEEVTLDNVKSELDEHKQILNKHTEQIQSLLIDNAETKQRLTNIETTNQEMKKDIKEIKSYLYTSQSNNNATLNQIVLTLANANTQMATQKTEAEVKVETTKSNDKTKIYIQLIVTGGVVIGAVLGFAKLLFS